MLVIEMAHRRPLGSSENFFDIFFGNRFVRITAAGKPHSQQMFKFHKYLPGKSPNAAKGRPRMK